MSGKPLIIELIEPEASLQDLCIAIEANTGISPDDQRLAFEDGSPLPQEGGGLMLSAIGVTSGTTLALVHVPDLMKGYQKHVRSDVFQDDSVYGSWVLIARHFAEMVNGFRLT